VGKDVDNQGKSVSLGIADSLSNNSNNLVTWGPITKSGVYAIIEKVTIDNTIYSANRSLTVRLKRQKK
jgi:hypothetical protein